MHHRKAIVVVHGSCVELLEVMAFNKRDQRSELDAEAAASLRTFPTILRERSERGDELSGADVPAALGRHRATILDLESGGAGHIPGAGHSHRSPASLAREPTPWRRA